MINFVAKSLVLFHTLLSLGAVVWSVVFFFNGRDYAWDEPRKDPIEWNAEGAPSKWLRIASDYDRSAAALAEAKNTRDRVYALVKPEIDSLLENEPFLPNNKLHFDAELKKLLDSPDALEVRRLKDGGLVLTFKDLGRPASEDDPVKGVSKSYKSYKADLKDLYSKIEKVDEEIRKQVSEIKRFTRELTGTDEGNKYVEPGLYQLLDIEFKAQTQLKIEIDEIKPHWSKAIEQARLYTFRHADLKETLERLKAAPAPAPKVQKKL